MTLSAPPVVALPDLHGRLDLLEGALALFPEAHVVVLGDVLDRGPAALACVRLLLELRERGRVTLLMGNHEHMALGAARAWRRFQERRDAESERRALAWWSAWMQAGGEQLRREAGGFRPERLPAELTAYLGALRPLVFVTADGAVHDQLPTGPSVLLSHASPPKVTPDFPDPFEAALWLRPSDGPFELPPGVRYSVHGHTPLRAPAQLAQQVYLDLGAYHTGRLALLPLDPAGPGEVTVLQGRGRAGRGLPMLGTPLPVRMVRLGARI